MVNETTTWLGQKCLQPAARSSTTWSYLIPRPWRLTLDRNRCPHRDALLRCRAIVPSAETLRKPEKPLNALRHRENTAQFPLARHVLRRQGDTTNVPSRTPQAKLTERTNSQKRKAQWTRAYPNRPNYPPGAAGGSEALIRGLDYVPSAPPPTHTGTCQGQWSLSAPSQPQLLRNYAKQ